MTTKNRKPMTFDIDRIPQANAELTPSIEQKKIDVIEKQQVGARIPKNKYRLLKSRAALEGVSVQDLVEHAIDQFLAS